MADIGLQRAPESLPVNPLRPPEPAGSAHTSVLDPRAPPWMGMLPSAPAPASMADMIAAQQTQLKMGEQRQQIQGRNALASLYADPANIDPNGALKPEAITKLGAAGFPDQALAVMGTQAEIGQRQQATRAAGQKFLSGEQERLVTQFEPLVGEYDDNVKKFGQARALQIGQEHYTAEREKAQAMGYSPAVVGNIPPNFDPERLRRTALGLKGSLEYQQSQNEEGRRQARDARDATHTSRDALDKGVNAEYIDSTGKQQTGVVFRDKDRGTTFLDQEGKTVKVLRELGTTERTPGERFIGTTADGKDTLYHYGPQGPVDDKNQPVDTGNFKSVRKVGTKAETSEGLLDADTLGTMADQYIAGDKSIFQNVGRGAQSAKNIANLRGEIAKRMAERGITGADMAAKLAEYDGQKAGLRTVGTRSANLELASNEAQQLIPLTRELSHKISRTSFPKINAILLAGEKETGDPDVVAFGQQLNSLLYVYTRALNPTGVPRVADLDHAREFLDKAWSDGQIDRALDQMELEIKAAHRSTGATREGIKATISGRSSEGGAAASAASGKAPAADPRPPIASGKVPASGVPIVPGADGSYALRPGSEDADFEQLPSGARFKGPDGKIRVKP